MTDIPFFRGQESVFKFFLNGTEVVLNTKSFDVKANVTKIADGVNGEIRDRLDRCVNYFEITCDCFQRDTKLIEALLSDIDNDDTEVTPLDKGGGVRIKVRDGTRKAFICKEIQTDDFNIVNSGRPDRVMAKLSFRCRFFNLATSS